MDSVTKKIMIRVHNIIFSLRLIIEIATMETREEKWCPVIYSLLNQEYFAYAKQHNIEHRIIK